MPSITLPKHWTARDALLVYEFLTEIQECIWRQYGVDLTEAYRIECGGEQAPGLQQDWIGWDDEGVF
jgi:hypothetical protein